MYPLYGIRQYCILAQRRFEGYFEIAVDLLPDHCTEGRNLSYEIGKYSDENVDNKENCLW